VLGCIEETGRLGVDIRKHVHIVKLIIHSVWLLLILFYRAYFKVRLFEFLNYNFHNEVLGLFDQLVTIIIEFNDSLWGAL
jgi:hypothetical protein